jgi:hypothetical protein
LGGKAGVNIALDKQALATCEPFDADHNDKVRVDDLVKAVKAALEGDSSGC